MTTPHQDSSHLSRAHLEILINGSSISREILESRGYQTVTTKAELTRLGFSQNQAIVPSLLIPVWNVNGEIGLYQSRPDRPRINKQAKPVKYETPAGAHMILDVHPIARPKLCDPSVPLVITEGIKKGDSIVSRSWTAIALLGVWNFRGSNEHGGKVVLADWESVALNDRPVFITFDSDVMLKREVHDALGRIGAFLASRHAKVSYIYLPSGPNGTKIGVDDFLAAGHTMDEVVAFATQELRRFPTDDQSSRGPYLATGNGFVWLKPTRDGPVETALTNFTARIVADLTEDDGVERRRLFEIEANLNGRSVHFSVTATQFTAMNWAVEYLGATALLYPGMTIRDHARTAVQSLSPDIEERTVYAHLGWRQVGEGWVYLHAGGAIGADGPVHGIDVRLPEGLDRFQLICPATPESEVQAVRASLRLVALAPLRLTIPLHAAVFHAALGGTDFGVHLVGPTGAGKSEIAALDQQHFGLELNARNLPGSWSRTANALEALAFYAKDALVVVDDFAPQGSDADVRRLNRDADRVLRAQGNHSGRLRLRADASLRSSKPPRGLILSTGEDVPFGQSLRARLLILELGKGDLDWHLLTGCQRDAAAGLYSHALAGFIRWLAPQFADLQKSRTDALVELRTRAAWASPHRRTPGIVANLAWAYRVFLQYAEECGAITCAEADTRWQEAWAALLAAGSDQVAAQGSQDPAQRFITLLRAALVAGQAHLGSQEGGQPAEAPRRGWRQVAPDVALGAARWQPLGRCIGWIEGDDLYLEPEIAFAVAKHLGEEQGETLAVSRRTLEKRLGEAGLLASLEDGRYTVRKVVQGRQRRVLHLSATRFESYDADSGLTGLSGHDAGAADLESVTEGPNRSPLDGRSDGESGLSSGLDEPGAVLNSAAVSPFSPESPFARTQQLPFEPAGAMPWRAEV